jgi:multicomponent Na+:H+ antiporter subunit B
VNSLILNTTARLLVALMLMFSVFLLLRGHNEPGGGFVGGLVVAAAFSLYGFAFGIAATRRALRVEPQSLIVAGLLVALGSGLVPVVFTGAPFLTGLWDDTTIPVIGKLGTPFVFDVGVYLVVTGVTLKIIFTLAEKEE